MGEPKITAAGDLYTIELPIENTGRHPDGAQAGAARPDRPAGHGVDDLPARHDLGGDDGRRPRRPRRARRRRHGHGRRRPADGGRRRSWRCACGSGCGGTSGWRRGGPPSPAAAAGQRGAGGQAPQIDTSKDKVIIVEPQNRPQVTIERIAGNEKKTITFKVRLNGITGTDCTFRYVSTRGGIVEKKVFIGKK